MHDITKRAIELWKELPDDQLGEMPHSYDIRVKLSREFSLKTSKVGNYSDAAIRILKIRKRRSKTPPPGRTGVLRGRIATAISTFLATHPDTSDAQIIAALSAILDAYRRGTVRRQGGKSAEELEFELEMEEDND